MQEIVDWQAIAENVRQRISSLFSKQEFTDVEFKVGTEVRKTFEAHKVILSSGSAVFASMFYGNLPERKLPIIIPDIEPCVFEQILEFIYLDRKPEKDENATLSLYQAAERYMMPLLQKACVTRLLQMQSNPEKTCSLFEKSLLYNIEKLQYFCKRRFSENTLDIINSNAFLEAQEISVKTILQRPLVTVNSEFDLIKGLINWTKHSSNRKVIFNHLLNYICFRNLQTNDWTTLIQDDPEIFSAADKTSISKYFADRSFKEIPNWCNISYTRQYNVNLIQQRQNTVTRAETP